MTEDTLLPFDLPAVRRKKVTADFGGGLISSDGGLVLLREAERRLRLAETLAGCIRDRRDPATVVHTLPAMLRFRMFAIACGYEDADDCDALRTDPLFMYGCPRACKRLVNARACDRVRSCIRPQRCGALHGRGPVWRCADRVHIKLSRSKRFEQAWFSPSGSVRSLSHAVRRPPHTPDGPGRIDACLAITPPPPGSGSPLPCSAWPRSPAPSCWRARSQPASAACAPASGPARSLPACRSAWRPGSLTWRR